MTPVTERVFFKLKLLVVSQLATTVFALWLLPPTISPSLCLSLNVVLPMTAQSSPSQDPEPLPTLHRTADLVELLLLPLVRAFVQYPNSNANCTSLIAASAAAAGPDVAESTSASAASAATSSAAAKGGKAATTAASAAAKGTGAANAAGAGKGAGAGGKAAAGAKAGAGAKGGKGRKERRTRQFIA